MVAKQFIVEWRFDMVTRQGIAAIIRVMSSDFSSLVQDLTSAVEALQASLPSTDNPSDLGQAHEHLSEVSKMLWDIDQDNPEPVGEEAVLSRSAAIAQDVVDHVVDMEAFYEASLQVTALEGALAATREAGYDAPNPGNREWFNGNEPANGSDF